jgi:hypothetical protein
MGLRMEVAHALLHNRVIESYINYICSYSYSYSYIVDW